MELFNYNEAFELENGNILPTLTIAYHTYGQLNQDKTNVIWICHALTANSDAAAWWPGVVGKKGFVDPSKYFIVCANILGSCYGSTGPLTIDPTTDKPYFSNFPMITIRDMVKAHIFLRKQLGIDKIYLLMGGSMGGYQALEWCAMENDLIQNLFLVGTSATESAWGIAVHTSQRLAIEADETWKFQHENAGQKGLKAARAFGVISYRNYQILVEKQTDPDTEKLDNYKASSYITYQGDKLVNRFNAFSYWLLTKSMDSHHLGRGRGGNTEIVLQKFKQKTLIMGVSSDILCPLHEQEFLAQHIPNSTLIAIDSPYGHDGFITEAEKISEALEEWL
ncbi:MAG TPA: homoserine O-acetyltransferase [Chitinophagaceae bacterium]|jgi:homoserine O-acetyltransferase|nr:homoserine O-acetyltransferase [Chitinophagaceae bacterium]